jgi:hypothetical protein
MMLFWEPWKWDIQIALLAAQIRELPRDLESTGREMIGSMEWQLDRWCRSEIRDRSLSGVMKN